MQRETVEGSLTGTASRTVPSVKECRIMSEGNVRCAGRRELCDGFYPCE